MTASGEDRVREVLRSALDRIAPGVGLDSVDPDGDLREEFDLDSVDLMNLVVLIDEELGIEIPETDYDRLATLNGMLGYLSRRISDAT